MKTFGNIIWHFPFFGFISAFFVYVFGLLLTLTIIAAPIGLGLMELGKLLFAPFGNVMIDSRELNIPQNKAWKAYSTVIMILYLPFGIALAFLAIIQTGLLFISIIGIPVGLVVAKALSTYFNPVGKKCVSSAVAAEIEQRKAQQYLDSKNKISAKDADAATISTNTLAQTIFCPDCGKQNSMQAKFCGGCGEQLLLTETKAIANTQAKAADIATGVITRADITSEKKIGMRNIAWIFAGILTLAIAWQYSLKDRNTTAEEIAPIFHDDEPAAVVHTESITPPAYQAPDISQEPVTKVEPAPAEAAPQKEITNTPSRPIQKPSTVKRASNKINQAESKKTETIKSESNNKQHATVTSQSSSVQSQSAQHNDQQIAEQSTPSTPAEQSKQHHGLRGLIQQVTGVDPGNVSSATEHQCTAGEKSMHVNGC